MSWLGSTIASRPRRSAGPKRPSSKTRPTFNVRERASRRPGELRQRQEHQRAAAKACSDQCSVETAETAQAAEDAATADLNLANSDVLVAQANIGDAKAQQQLETATLDFHTLTAPYDAMVTARSQDWARPSTRDNLCSRSSIRKRLGARFCRREQGRRNSVGEPAEIVLRSRPGQESGQVARSSRKATGSTKSSGLRSLSTKSPQTSTSASRPRSTSPRPACRGWVGS